MLNFVLKEAEPGLSLELDCGKTVWTPVSINLEAKCNYDGIT